jgi:FkbM family methyltransferase
LCVIARDEEEMLPECLASARDAVDRMIVVDTGSSDRTIEFARRMGARVVEHEWADDFAAARNAALEHVKSGFILVLDADERLASGAGTTLRRAVRQGGFDLGMLPLHHADGADATVEEIVSGRRRMGDPISLPRLLRRTPELRWEGLIHESVGAWAEGRPTRIIPANIAHYGAHREIRESMGKDARNLRLLEQRSLTDNDDPNVKAYLARELQRDGQLEEAVIASAKAWNGLLAARGSGDLSGDCVLPTTVHALLLLELGRMDELVAVLDRAAREEFDHPNLWFLQGVAAEQRALKAEDARPLLTDAATSYRRCLESAGEEFPGEPIPGSRGWQTWTRLGTVALRTGRSQEAIEAFQAALAERPGEAEAEFGLAEGMILAGRESEALGVLEFWVEQDRVDAWLLLSLATLGLGLDADARLFGERAIDAGRRQKLLAPHRQEILNELAESLGEVQASAPGCEADDKGAHEPARKRTALAWPLYGPKSEVDFLLARYGQTLADDGIQLLLVHDTHCDGDVELAIRELEEAYAHSLPEGTPLDIELLDEPLGVERLAALRESVDAVIELPGCREGARRELLDALGARGLASGGDAPDVFGGSYRIEQQAGQLTHLAALERVLERGVEIATVIDLGAAGGGWSSSMKQGPLPHCRFHLIEAQPRWREQLEQSVAAVPDLSFTHAAVAERDGECWFQIPDANPYGGRAYESESTDGLVRVPAVCIDSEVERQGLEGPFAIKFDIHGLEREVLRGARRTLQRTNLLVMEMLNYGDDGRYFPELLAHVTELGFQCVDIAEPMWRPHDGAFWQLDMFFVPMSRPEACYRGF